ncbi:LysM domain-containing GPI-anchored protein 2 [Linum grandiflorum]
MCHHKTPLSHPTHFHILTSLQAFPITKLLSSPSLENGPPSIPHSTPLRSHYNNLHTPNFTTSADDDYTPDNPPKCNSFIGYISPENATTTFASVQAVYTIRDIRLLFGANNLPLTTPPNQTIPPKQRIKIPFPCRNRGTYC